MLIEPAGTGVVGDGAVVADTAASGGAGAVGVGYVVASGPGAVIDIGGDTVGVADAEADAEADAVGGGVVGALASIHRLN